MQYVDALEIDAGIEDNSVTCYGKCGIGRRDVDRGYGHLLTHTFMDR